MDNRKYNLELAPFQQALKCRVHWSSTLGLRRSEEVISWFRYNWTSHTLSSLLSIWSKMASGSKGIGQTTHGGNSSLQTCPFIPAEIQTPQLWLQHWGASQKEPLKYHGEHKLNLKRRNFGMKFLFLLHYLTKSSTSLLLQDHCVPFQKWILV